MLMNRRDFSKSLAMAAAVTMLDMKNIFAAESAPNLTIDKIEIFPVRYPMVMRFKFFEGPVTPPGRPSVIIKITANDGTVGWGESVPIPRWSGETLEGAVVCLKNYLIPLLIGKKVFDLEGQGAQEERGRTVGTHDPRGSGSELDPEPREA
jgi:L-alanine-DL-glutamate epimerase-like enolase superfamily enzyme